MFTRALNLARAWGLTILLLWFVGAGIGFAWLIGLRWVGIVTSLFSLSLLVLIAHGWGHVEVALAKWTGAKLVLNVSDVWPATITAIGMMSERHPAVRMVGWLEKCLYRRSDLVAGTSFGITEHINRRFPDVPTAVTVSKGMSGYCAVIQRSNA